MERAFLTTSTINAIVIMLKKLKWYSSRKPKDMNTIFALNYSNQVKSSIRAELPIADLVRIILNPSKPKKSA